MSGATKNPSWSSGKGIKRSPQPPTEVLFSSMRAEACIIWVGPPPTNSSILGTYKDPNIITIGSRGHYQREGAQPNVSSTWEVTAVECPGTSKT